MMAFNQSKKHQHYHYQKKTLSGIFKEIYLTAFESLVPFFFDLLILEFYSSDSIDNQSIMSWTVPKSIERIWKPWIWVSFPQ